MILEVVSGVYVRPDKLNNMSGPFNVVSLLQLERKVNITSATNRDLGDQI